MTPEAVAELHDDRTLGRWTSPRCHRRGTAARVREIDPWCRQAPLRTSIVPKPDPRKFHDVVVNVARDREPGQHLKQIGGRRCGRLRPMRRASRASRSTWRSPDSCGHPVISAPTSICAGPRCSEARWSRWWPPGPSAGGVRYHRIRRGRRPSCRPTRPALRAHGNEASPPAPEGDMCVGGSERGTAATACGWCGANPGLEAGDRSRSGVRPPAGTVPGSWRGPRPRAYRRGARRAARRGPGSSSFPPAATGPGCSVSSAVS